MGLEPITSMCKTDILPNYYYQPKNYFNVPCKNRTYAYRLTADYSTTKLRKILKLIYFTT